MTRQSDNRASGNKILSIQTALLNIRSLPSFLHTRGELVYFLLSPIIEKEFRVRKMAFFVRGLALELKVHTELAGSLNETKFVNFDEPTILNDNLDFQV